jgi:hypothetical protein
MIKESWFDWFLARARDYFLLQNVQTSFGVLPASYSMDTVCTVLG